MNPPVPWEEFLPDTDHQHRMRFQRADVATFFSPTDPTGSLLAERRHWSITHPERHLLHLPEADPAIHELATFLGPPGRDAPLGRPPSVAKPLRPPNLSSPTDAAPPPPTSPRDPPSAIQHSWFSLTSQLEPDLLLLTPDPAGPHLIAAAVCFPSSWAPETKLGLPLLSIHDVVPDLNADLGRPIQQFLLRLRPGAAWSRANWGLSATSELNQHPARSLPRLHARTPPDTVWFRLEHQLLFVLPQTRAIVFAIRIHTWPITELRPSPEPAERLARALRTLPEAMARYKGLDTLRHSLADWLDLAIAGTRSSPVRPSDSEG
jgi:hypothetical protein